MLLLLPQRYVFSSKSQPKVVEVRSDFGCCCYHKGTYFQANHNEALALLTERRVVVATTKVRIFKQITTAYIFLLLLPKLLLLPQRYVFSSKSQRTLYSFCRIHSCCCYHKGTYFQANHNMAMNAPLFDMLLLLPQRYVFSSKSQLQTVGQASSQRCCCYHKGTYFQANHNKFSCCLSFCLLLLLPQRYVFSSKSQRG